MQMIQQFPGLLFIQSIREYLEREKMNIDILKRMRIKPELNSPSYKILSDGVYRIYPVGFDHAYRLCL